MVRTQVQLTEDQVRILRREALKSGVSIAELIRRSVDDYLEHLDGGNRRELIERAKKAVGKYHAGLQDLAQNHDRYLAEDFLK